MFPPALSTQRQRPAPGQAAESLRILTDPSYSRMAAGNQERAAGRDAVAELPYTRNFYDRTMANNVGQSLRRSNALEDADLDRTIEFGDRQFEDYDTEFRAPHRAQVLNRALDVDSEAKAGRQFMPAAKALYDRTRRAASEDLNTRYLQPALIEADTDLEVEDRRGAATLGAAEIRGGAQQAGQAQAALLRGLLSRMAENDPRIIEMFDEVLRPGRPQPGR